MIVAIPVILGTNSQLIALSIQKIGKAMEAIKFPAIDFQSDLVEKIVELERIRGELGTGSTPAELFLELHALSSC